MKQPDSNLATHFYGTSIESLFFDAPIKAPDIFSYASAKITRTFMREKGGQERDLSEYFTITVTELFEWHSVK